MFHPLSFCHTRGFTLIEVMLMMALVFIVALIASPFYGTFLFTEERAVAQSELRGSLEKARLYSMTGKGDAPWGVTVADRQIILFQGDSYPGSGVLGNEVYALGGRVEITGMGEVVFDPDYGAARTTPVIVISDDWESDSVTINSEGVFQGQQ